MRTVCCIIALATAAPLGAGCASVSGTAALGGVGARSAAGHLAPLARGGEIVFVNTPSASGVVSPGLFAIQMVQRNGAGRITVFSRHREIDYPRWPPDGKQIVFSMNSAHGKSSGLYIMNANGTKLRKVNTGRPDNEAPAWSPDGAKIAFSSHIASSLDQAIFVKDLKTGTVTRVTGGTADDGNPAWSPDGNKIAFERCGVRRGGTCHLWVKNLATRRLSQLTRGAAFDVDPAWSPDGRRIAFASFRSGKSNIFTVRATGGRSVQITKINPGSVTGSPSWSPDGRWIAFESQRNGPFNIFAVRAVRNGAVTRITNIKLPQNAEHPDWSHQH